MKTFFARNLFRLTTPLGWLCVYLLLVQGALPGLVLCFGSGGHIAVETPHSHSNHPTPQNQSPCLDVLLLLEKPDEQRLVVASGAASHTLLPVLVHAAATLQWFLAPPFDTLLPSGVAPMLPLALLPPVILRI